jgi:predicted dehydrogenase
MSAINVLVVGTGMYVSGRGTDGYGTVLPALLEWKKAHTIGDIWVVGSNPRGIKQARHKISNLMRGMGIYSRIQYLPKGTKINKKSYLGAIKEIPKPGCAIIAVPDNLHREVAAATIKTGLHTLVVKPLAPTLREVNELIALQRKNRVYCAVEFHKRFDLANLKLRDIIAEKKIGDPLYFLAEYSQRKSIPSKRFVKWVKETNVFQYLGIHYIDIIYLATKAKPIRAMAIGQKGYLALKGIDTYDSVQGIIEWKMPGGKKFLSHILTNWIDPESTSAVSDQKIKVIGTKGRFESDQKKRGVTSITDEKGIEEPNPYFCSSYGAEGSVFYRGYGIESICRFLDDVRDIENGSVKIEDLEDKRPTFRQSLAPTAVLEAVNKSLTNGGKWVTI